jgi:hypothetical protein
VVLAAVVALLYAEVAPAAAQSFVPAQSARAFGDSLGVNVRLTHLDTSYGDFDTLRARLRELGVRYVNDSICATCEYQITRLNALADIGIHSTLGVGSLKDGTASIAPALRALRERVPRSVVSIAGVNEPDISGDPNWIANTRAFQAELYRQVKADPFLARLPVIGPSLVHRESRAALGNLSAHLDRGNIHPYPGGNPPLQNLADERQLMSSVAGSKPLVATEVGYHTDLAFTGPHRPASEQAVATYTPRIALEAFRFGLDRTYLYQFADYWNAADATRFGLPPSENSFGLLRWNLSPKPAFYALRNLLRAVDSESAPVAGPGGLRLAIEGAGPDVSQLLLRSADGSYALVLWRSVSVWDRTALRDLSPAPDRVDVALGEPISVARRFDPVTSDVETQRWANPTRISVDLAGTPVVVRLVPPGSGGPTAGTGKVLGAGKRCVRSARHKKGSRKVRHKRSHGAARRRGAPARAIWRLACVRASRRPRR